MSADGRYVVFDSWAGDLVPGDVVGTLDVFVYDRVADSVSLVSKSSAGVAGNAASAEPVISGDGRHVAFSSWAANLVPGDVNGLQDVFVRDLQTGSTWRVSEDALGVGGIGPSHSPDISATGQFVAFASQAYNLAETPDLNGVSYIFVHDHLSGVTSRVSVASDGSEGSGASIEPTLSADGSRVAFTSGAPDLVGDDDNTVPDVFVHELLSGKTRLMSRAADDGVGNADSDAPSLSADGQWLLFGSTASDLVLSDGNAARDVFLSALP